MIRSPVLPKNLGQSVSVGSHIIVADCEYESRRYDIEWRRRLTPGDLEPVIH